MNPLKALLLGLIQGVAGAFPVSSSGHVQLVARALGEEQGASLAFLSLLHLGTLIAVVLVFYRDILRLLAGYAGIFRDLFFHLAGRFGGGGASGETRRVFSDPYRRFGVLLLVSLLPSLIVGRFLAGAAATAAARPIASAIGLFVTALLLLVASFFRTANKGPLRAKFQDALVVGIAQGASVFPGVSRLGLVLASSELCGYSRRFAAKTAYLLGVPMIVGALSVELPGSGALLAGQIGVPSCILGVLAAAAAGVATLRVAFRVLTRDPGRFFSVYCFAIGVATVLVTVLGR